MLLWIKRNGIMTVMLLVCAMLFYTAYITSKQAKEISSTNIELKNALNDEITKKSVSIDNGYTYFFNLSEDMNVRMNQLCIIYEVDINIVYSILMVENPGLDTQAINRNSNGTIDEGLFQLNSRYAWTEFVPKYWSLSRDPNLLDWRDNMTVAVAHIADLYSCFETAKETFSAYNCGRSATIKGNVPERTAKRYIPAAMAIYNDIKQA